MKTPFLCASSLLLAAGSSVAATKVLQSFEGDGFGDWKVEGTAFGLAPIAGKCDGLTAELTGYSGESLACSAHGGDASTGSLLSPEFKITENFLAFLIAGGKHPGKTAVQLLVDGKVVKEATGEGSLRCGSTVWDVAALKGKSARIQIIDQETGSWGMIAADQFILTDYPNPKFDGPTRGGKAHLAGLTASKDIPGLTIPEGTTAKVVADFKKQFVKSPTALTIDEQGDVFVSETHRFRHGIPDNRDHLYWYLDDISSKTTEDRRKMYEKWAGKEEKTSKKFLTEETELVRKLSEPGPDGVFKKSIEYARDFNEILDGTGAGVFAYEGTVYFACIPKIWALSGSDAEGRATKRQVIQDGFGVRVSFSGHDLNGFALGPDGRIYGTMGDRGMSFKTKEGKSYQLPDEGAIFRFDPDGSNFEIIHTGLRNPKEIAFDDHGNAFSVDNNSDQGDLARVIYIVEGADSGWNMGNQAMHSHHRQIGMDERPPNRWMEERMWAPKNDAQPAYILPPVANLTSGPSGLTYHPGTGFLESEAGRFLICDYRGGAANSGIWSFKVDPDGAGMKLSDSRQFNWGAGVTDVEYSYDGKLFISDFMGGWTTHDDGRVYELKADKMWREEEAQETANLIKGGFAKRPLDELGRLLEHADMRVRVRAELELTRCVPGAESSKGRKEPAPGNYPYPLPKGTKPESGYQVLLEASRNGKQITTRLHGIWGLGVIARRGAAIIPSRPDPRLAASNFSEPAFAELCKLLTDQDSEIRAQVIKVLGDSGQKREVTQLDALITDTSPRVRLFAMIAAGKLKATSSIPTILKSLEGNTDPYLRTAGAYALSLLLRPDELGVLRSHKDSSVRMTAVVALRRVKGPQLSAFLDDKDQSIVDEAVRSINDQNIESVRPLVAKQLDKPAPSTRTTMLWRRLLHSAFRAGDEENARRVLKVALDPKVSEANRLEAFRLLNEWAKPFSVDQSTGRMSPLPARTPEVITKVLSESVGGLVKLEGKLLEPALELVATYKLDLSKVEDAALKALVQNPKLPGAARSEALDLYASRKPAGLDALLAELSTASDDDLAIGAIKRLTQTAPESAVAGITQAVQKGSARRQQQASKLAATLNTPAIAKLFSDQLTVMAKSGGVGPAALELLESAESRKEPEIKMALEAFKAAQKASTDPLAAWLPSLEGGDPVKGGQIFESHPAGQCMRCHAGGHGGGDAGPNLAGVALRGDRRYLLESLVNPGAKVAMGFGISTVTLKGGKSVSGIVIEDKPDHVDLDSSGKVLRVLRSDLESMTPPVSSMPPMAFILNATELRDTVAWLSQNKDKKVAEKKRPAPEIVKP
jgi:quinoprotein glucose dehydrogenase